MRRLWIAASVGVCLGAGVKAAHAQSMVESAAAAAGGSAAAVAGKTVSSGIDKVFTKVGEIGKQAAAIGEDGKKRGRALPARPEVPQAKASAAQPMAVTPTKAARIQPVRVPQAKPVRYAATRIPMTVDAPAPVLPPGSEPPPSVPTDIRSAPPPDLRQIKTGSSRADLEGRMGAPSSKLTMVEDGKLVEVYRWRQGAARLINGVVKEVTPAQH